MIRFIIIYFLAFLFIILPFHGFAHMIGDINDDGYVDLPDAILALKVVTGLNPSEIRENYPTSGVDVNGNLKIDETEAIHVLQVMAGLRVNYDAGVKYVSTTGNDSNSGTRDSPYRTITHALASTAGTGYPEIRIQAGTYHETLKVSIAEIGRKLLGGYGADWSHNAANIVSVIAQQNTGAIILQNINTATIFSDMTIIGIDAISAAESSYAIRVLNSLGPVTFQKMHIQSGNGARGIAGLNGTSNSSVAQSGNDGGNAATFSTFCDNTSRGTGGAGAGSGGNGGNGGTMDTICSSPYNYNARAGSNGVSV